VVERSRVSDLGRIEVVARPAVRAETPQPRLAIGGVCLDGKGNEHDVLNTSGQGTNEVMRCRDRLHILRAYYRTGSMSIPGEVRVSDGRSYVDCEQGQSLVERGGRFACVWRRDVRAVASAARERSSSDVPSEQPVHQRRQEIAITGLELTGGVGNVR
jgi:hypothetical protein